MAKLTVRNVGPIREAEIDVKKHTVFIGPQGTGKSTLAKLIAIGGDTTLSEASGQRIKSLITKYSLSSYINDEKTYLSYDDNFYYLIYNQGFHFNLTDEGQNIIDRYLSLFTEQSADSSQILPLHKFRNSIEYDNHGPIYRRNAMAQSVNFYKQILPIIVKIQSILTPTERHIFPILSESIWSLLDANINLPESIKVFGREFERARNSQNHLEIPFLNVQYHRENSIDLIYYSKDEAIALSQSASGYQSIIPLLLVVEHQRRQSQRRFIIEEPELNLYPTAQKDLIYSLIGGLQPDVTYQDAEWVITTHSPYVLTSLNTLMLAYKVAQRSDELRAEVEKIVPARCWINPDEFAAYYVDNGTVESITNPETGLINDSRLDDVSDDFAGEQDALFDLYRTARVDD